MRKFFVGLLVGAILPPLVVTLLALTGWLPISARSEPPTLEKRLLQAAVVRSVSHQAPMRKNPLEATDENLLAGLKFFHDSCDGCHGTGAKRSIWGTTDFYPRVPQFGFEPPRLRDWQIYWVVKNGIRYTGMGGNDPDITEDQAWKVALFLTRWIHCRPMLPRNGIKRNSLASNATLACERLQ